MGGGSWSRSSTYLRAMHDNRYAQANAVVLVGARGRWHRAVVTRTSVHDLLFTLPGDDGYPFAQSVAVSARDDGGFTVSPSAAVGPWHVTNDPRDALVAQLLDDLRTGDLAGVSLVAQVEREGPGVISARFDEDRYLVTVRPLPTGATQARGKL